MKKFLTILTIFFSLIVKAQNENVNLNPSGNTNYRGKFYPTLKTEAHKASSSLETTSFLDEGDIRVFPSSSIQATPWISINKNNPNELFISCDIANTGVKTGFFYSNNGGLTWNGDENPSAQNNYVSSFNTSTSNGKIHLITSSRFGDSYKVQTSQNNGANWVNQTTPFIDIINEKSETFGVSDNYNSSPFSNNLYTTWSTFGTNGLTTDVKFQKSTNNNVSYTPPITIKNGRAIESKLQTGLQGQIYACWADRISNETFASAIGFCKSLDGGNTFSAPQRVVSYFGVRPVLSGQPYGTNPSYNNIDPREGITMGVDKSNGIHSGRIYIAVPFRVLGNSIIRLTFSDDQGVSWSSLQTISVGNIDNCWQPTISVDECSGEVWIAYYGLNSSNFETNTYVARSIDGGNTWNHLIVSDVSHITSPIVSSTVGNTNYAGWHLGIIAYQGKVHIVWNDNRNGTWQIYYSPINIFTINGNGNPTCSNSIENYSLNTSGVASNIIWSASVPQIILTQNGQSCTANNNGFIGTYILTATLTTGCGNIITINKQIQILAGPPSLSSIQASWVQNGVTSLLANCNQIGDIAYFPCTPNSNSCGDQAFASGSSTNPTATNITWSVLGGCGFPIEFSSLGNTFNVKLSRSYFNPNANNTYVILRCTFSNGCGFVFKDYAFYISAQICSLQAPCSGSTILYNRSTSLGKSTNPNTAEFAISPNPSSGQFQLNLVNGEKDAVFKEVIITNKMGILIFRQKYTDAQKLKTINLFNYPSDIYMIKTFDGKIWHTQKLTLMK